jgi:hypothetical protein
VFRPLPPAFLETLIGENLKVPARVWEETLEGLLDAVPSSDRGITAPTLILWGDRDEFLARSDQEALATAIAGSRLVTYEGTGHAVRWEQPEREAVDIVALAKRLPKPGPALGRKPTPAAVRASTNRMSPGTFQPALPRSTSRWRSYPPRLRSRRCSRRSRVRRGVIDSRRRRHPSAPRRAAAGAARQVEQALALPRRGRVGRGGERALFQRQLASHRRG